MRMAWVSDARHSDSFCLDFIYDYLHMNRCLEHRKCNKAFLVNVLCCFSKKVKI